MKNKFSQGTIEKLKYYVYLLQDPRDSKIFYIGKGLGNRIFNHIKWLLSTEKKSLQTGSDFFKNLEVLDFI